MSLPAATDGQPATPRSKTVLGQFLQLEIAARIDRVNSNPWSSNARDAQAREIAMAVAEASVEFNVDPFLIVAMIEVESRYHASAVGTVGERGLMQVRPTTAAWIVPETDALYGCNLFQVRCNVMVGTRYISHLHGRLSKRQFSPINREDQISRTLHTLRSYNAGPAKADRMPASDAAEMDVRYEPGQVPYAVKITFRAERMRQRYLDEASGLDKEVVTTLAMAQ